MSQETVNPFAAEQALATIPGFSGASIGSRLSNGPTNTSFQIELASEHYVLRVDKPLTQSTHTRVPAEPETHFYGHLS